MTTQAHAIREAMEEVNRFPNHIQTNDAIKLSRDHLPAILSDLEAKDKEIAELVGLLRVAVSAMHRTRELVAKDAAEGNVTGSVYLNNGNLATTERRIDAKLKEMGHGQN